MAVGIDEVEAASRRLASRVVKTILMDSSGLTDRLSTSTTLPTALIHLLQVSQVFFKCEMFQHTGSMKYRGATNAVLAHLERLRTSPDDVDGERRLAAGGTVTFVAHSSGNHGHAVAKAAAEEGHACVVVMPRDAPPPKIAAIRAVGATVVLCEPNHAAREAGCEIVMRECAQAAKHAVLVRPSDDDCVIAGQGTIGLEILSDLPDVDGVIVPVGGGATISGVALALKTRKPSVKVFGAEPLNADDAARSLAARTLQGFEAGQPNTIADGLRAPLCARTFAHIAAHVDDIITVTESELKQALVLVFERLKVVIEPAAAASAAVVLFHAHRLHGCSKLVVLLSGGNVDFLNFRALVAD